MYTLILYIQIVGFAAYFDYNPVNSILVFTGGMMTGSSVCTNVNIIDDNVVEMEIEYFIMSLTAIEPAITNISLAATIISIEERNNDGMVGELHAFSFHDQFLLHSCVYWAISRYAHWN